MNENIPTIYRDPFSLGSPIVSNLPAGLAISEIVARLPYLPPDFAEAGEIRLNDQPIPRDMWGMIKPKATCPEQPIVLTFHAGIRGGGGGDGGGKSSVALIASLVVVIAASAVTGGALAPLGGVLAGLTATSTGALALGAGISLPDDLLIAALTPPVARQ